jgi:CheY-like chemotaxis protein
VQPSPPKILVVDDDAFVRGLLRTVLEKSGYQVLTTESGAQALEIFRSEPNVVLVITDVIMPGMQGRELVDQMLSERADLHVLFISGFSVEPKSLRGFDFLAKPFTPEQVAFKVRRILKGQTA